MNLCLLLSSLLLSIVCGQYYLKDQTLGCDGVVGSGKHLDHCGVCDGSNNSCKIISGIYTRRTSGAKYEVITEFPEGAERINITEAKNSRNYLALVYSNTGESILNGNWSLSWSGKHEAAGTTVVYTKSRRRGQGENIYIAGPINTRIQLLLLVQAKNPGVFYDYVIQLNKPKILPPFYADGPLGARTAAQRHGPVYLGHTALEDGFVYDSASSRRSSHTPTTFTADSNSKFQWKSVGPTECSHSCGGGYQEVKIVCVLTSSQVKVTEENCKQLSLPEQRRVECNTQACPPEWKKGEWSECSITCGRGTQYRSVECKRKLSMSHEVSVFASKCSASQKPSTIQMCELKECYSWRTGQWSKCSTNCGKGHRARKVQCQDSKGRNVESSLCVLNKPRQNEQCYESCDQTWFYSDWSGQCSRECSQGSMTRQVYCPADVNIAIRPVTSLCGGKPVTSKSCDQENLCGKGKWFTGEWTECEGDCEEAYQTRDVVCMKTRDDWYSVTNRRDCVSEKEPDNKQKCRPSNCDSEEPVWLHTDWGKCSLSCGKGYQRREIKCLDSEMVVSEACSENNKPQSVKECSLKECPQVQNVLRDPSCYDKYSSCIVVVKARLCRLLYYKQLCCASCSKSQ